MGNDLRLVLMILCGFLSTFASSQTIHKMAVRADVRFRFATTEITCLMSNDKDEATELTFDVTLPKDAFIANFSMEIEGKNYPGNVKEKQKARKEYQAAVESGSSGGLVEQSARHSNKFDVSVNIAARSNVTFTLLYQELLRRRFGSYEYSVYIDAETLSKVREYAVEIFIQDRNKILDVRTPAMRKEVISNAVEESENALTQITNPTETTVYVVYRPTPDQLKEQGAGWFVVQYDVDSDSAGDLLVVDGYFVHFFVPPDDLPPLPLDIVFVLDISGSMAGRKLDQLKDAMRIILDDLRETDRFNILLFDGSVQQWEGSLQEASESNVNRAQVYTKTINYRGSTNLHLALMRGLELLQGSREASRVPMMFFLTDGEATAGEQNSAKIVADVSQKNEGVVSIYSLAFGSGADYRLLRQISASNKGFARKIYEASDASEQVLGLYREISTIVIRGLSVSYHSTSNNDGGDDDGLVVSVDNSTITICDLSHLFGNSDFVVAGKLENAESLMMAPEKAGGLKLEVSGLGAKQKINFVLEENDLNSLTLSGENPFWTVPRDLSKMAERAWAFLRIKQLLEEKVAAVENKDLVEELDKKILELSLKYHFVTPLTSMVVTRPEDRSKESESMAASFRDDDDMPAARKHNFQPSYSSHKAIPQLAHAQIPALMGRPSLFSSGQRRRYDSRGPRGPGAPAMDLDDMYDSQGPGHSGPLPSLPQATRMMVTSTWAPYIRPRPTRPPGVLKGDKRKQRRMRKKKGGKGKKRKGKRCIRNKRVVLESVLVHGQQVPAACLELKAARSPVRNYTLFSDRSGNFSVMVALKRKFLVSLHIHRENSNISIEVNSDGNLTFRALPAGVPDAAHVTPDGQSLLVRQGPVTVGVNITMKTCKISFVSVSIDVGADDDVRAVGSKYTGIAAKMAKKSRVKRRKGKAKKMRKVPKGCMASKVPFDQARVVKGKFLMRFSV